MFSEEVMGNTREKLKICADGVPVALVSNWNVKCWPGYRNMCTLRDINSNNFLEFSIGWVVA